MAIDEKIARKIHSIQGNDTPIVVALCGAADLGKSYLSSQIVKRLNRLGTKASHLTLDSYLMKRAQRIKHGLSGYQPEAHDLCAVRSALIDFKNGRKIKYSPYDHQSGSQDSKEQYIDPCSVLILDGVHSMHEKLMPCVNISIFVYTDDDLLKCIRSKADLTKRKQTQEFSKSNEDAEFRYYKQHVEPYKKKANCLLYLEYQWHYRPSGLS